MVNSDIPDIIVRRLPSYLQVLLHLKKHGATTTSSHEIGEILGISAAQIRKDLSHFGEFGKQGTGYSITYLIDQLTLILHVDRVWEIALVGAGDLGHAIARYQGFTNRGFQIKLIFDIDPSKIGRKVGEFTILDISTLSEEIQKHQIKIAMLTVPAGAAQSVASQLIKAGIKSILSYAPITLSLPEEICCIEYANPILQLQHMTYYLGE
jgi:redox-sensing transcriptional repressor